MNSANFASVRSTVLLVMLAIWGCERQPDPMTSGPLYQFSNGQAVVTTTDVGVRSGPNNFSSVVDTKLIGATGTILASPGTLDATGDNTIYWQVQFSSGPPGWVSGVFLMPGTSSPPVTFTCNHYVSPTGITSGDGNINAPWSLSHALKGGNLTGPRLVTAGDTVCLRDGTYTGNQVAQDTLDGLPGNFIVFRQYPNERAIIDYPDATDGGPSTLTVRGSYLVFWGFELTNSNPTRIQTGTPTSHFRPDLIYSIGDHNRFVALVLHDGSSAYHEKTNVDVEFTGLIIYNQGWQATDRGHGHGIYVRSNTGPVRVLDNIVFNNFGYGLHGYNQDGDGQKGVVYDGNVTFDNGSIAYASSPNIMLGGVTVGAEKDTVRNNMTYYAPSLLSEVNSNGITGLRVGYSTTANVDVQIVNNYAIGGDPALEVNDWQTALVSGNTTYSTDKVLRLNDVTHSGYTWTSNTHYRDPAAPAWSYNNNSGTDFATWKINATPLGGSDVPNATAPTVARVFVRPVKVDGNPTGQGNIVVYNWGNASSVPVDLSPVLNNGDSYKIWNVQDLWGTPVSGTYTGSTINLTITTPTPPAPIGGSSRPPVATGLGFQVFIVRKQ